MAVTEEAGAWRYPAAAGAAAQGTSPGSSVPAGGVLDRQDSSYQCSAAAGAGAGTCSGACAVVERAMVLSHAVLQGCVVGCGGPQALLARHLHVVGADGLAAVGHRGGIPAAVGHVKPQEHPAPCAGAFLQRPGEYGGHSFASAVCVIDCCTRQRHVVRCGAVLQHAAGCHVLVLLLLWPLPLAAARMPSCLPDVADVVVRNCLEA